MSETNYDSGLTKNYDQPLYEGAGVVIYEDDKIADLYIAYEVKNGDLGREIAWFKRTPEDAYQFCVNWGISQK